MKSREHARGVFHADGLDLRTVMFVCQCPEVLVVVGALAEYNGVGNVDRLVEKIPNSPDEAPNMTGHSDPHYEEREPRRNTRDPSFGR